MKGNCAWVTKEREGCSTVCNGICQREGCGRVRRSRDRSHFLLSNQKDEGLYAKVVDCGEGSFLDVTRSIRVHSKHVSGIGRVQL